MASLGQHKLSLAKPRKSTLLLPKQHILEVVQKLLNGSDSQLLDPQNKSSPINSTAWPAEAVSRASQPPNDTKEAEACKSLELNFEHFWTPCPPLNQKPLHVPTRRKHFFNVPGQRSNTCNWRGSFLPIGPKASCGSPDASQQDPQARRRNPPTGLCQPQGYPATRNDS